MSSDSPDVDLGMADLSLNNDYQEWFKEYSAIEGNELNEDSEVLKAVVSDVLDPELVARRIQDLTPQDPLINGFCKKCQHLFDNWPIIGGSSTRKHGDKPDPNFKGWEHATARSCNTFEIEGAARLGCRFCTFLLQTFKDSEFLDTFRKIEVRLYKLKEEGTASLSVQNWGTNPIQLMWIHLPGKVCTSCNSGVALDVKFTSAFLPPDADCYNNPKDVLDIANKWLTTCCETHELCKSDDQGTLPTRLISLSGSLPKLILTSELLERPRYATLSHSWGLHDTIKLTTENLHSFTQGLPPDLPITYTDTFTIVRALNLEYIWIDSLCILQNSVPDWDHESALMETIYGKSTITIAASSAVNSSQGLHLKPPIFSNGLRARITDGGNQRVQDFRPERVYEKSTSESYLATRAWALQERLLPPRTIHFGNRGAFWECRTTLASEYLPDGFPAHLVRPLVRRNSTIAVMWSQIVGLYSAANLSFGKDKLPALSGIAHLGYKESQDQYLAGLWRKDIEVQLCWRRWPLEADDDSPSRRPAWRAPTWSWASIDGRVFWHHRQPKILERTHAHVLDAGTTLLGEDTFGQVTAGFVRMACSGMLAGKLRYRKQLTTEPHEEMVTFIPDIEGDKNKEVQFQISLDVQDDHILDTVYLLPILSGRTGLGSKKDKDEQEYTYEMLVQGVVLSPTKGKKGEFLRIGFFGLYKDKPWFRGKKDVPCEDTYDSFLDVLGKLGKGVAERVCEEVVENEEYPEEKYVVTLF